MKHAGKTWPPVRSGRLTRHAAASRPWKKIPQKAGTILLIFGAYAAFTDAGDRLSGMQRKHDAKIEAWTLCCRLKNRSSNDRYYALFFLSGKLLFLKGNYAHYSALSLPGGKYRHESSTILPPLKKVRHDYTTLDEKMGGHSIRKGNRADSLSVCTKFKRLRQCFSISVRKPFFSFREVMGHRYDRRKFDWYILPRCSITVCTQSGDTLHGNGHFQQFWGDEGGANCDWLVLHTGQGYDLTIAHFPEDKKKTTWLPGDYIFLSATDSISRTITAFDIVASEWWTSGTSKKRYPLHFLVHAPQDSIELSVTALKSDQTRTIAGKEYWYGFGKVTGTIRGMPQNGWGYLAPLGRPEKNR